MIVLRSILLLISLSNKQGVRDSTRNIHNSSCITSPHSLVWCIEDTKAFDELHKNVPIWWLEGILPNKGSSILTLRSSSPEFCFNIARLKPSKSNAINHSLAQTSAHTNTHTWMYYNIHVPSQLHILSCMRNIIIMILYNSRKQIREAIHNMNSSIGFACGAI